MSRAAISLASVSKAFDGRPVLEDVSFDVQQGEAFCLLGRSGTGKSVTLKLIIGLITQDSGTIRIGDAEVQNLERQELMDVRKGVGFLFQNAALFDSVSLADNLAFVLRRHTAKSKDEIAEIVKEKLAEVRLEDDGNMMPADLSGGMRKRAGLARALVLDPPIVLVDEPSSGLDRITAGEIYDLLSKLKGRKKTLVIVTHDVLGVGKLADRLCVLDHGHAVACGTPEELKKDSNELVRSLIGGGVL